MAINSFYFQQLIFSPILTGQQRHKVYQADNIIHPATDTDHAI
jgi:hypothetical protein